MNRKLLIRLFSLLIVLNACKSKVSPTEDTGLLTLDGFIEADEITVAPEVGGRVVALLADVGDEIEVGMPLAHLDDRIAQAHVDMAEAKVAEARAGLSMALTQQSMLTLATPISGIVAPYNIQVGELASPGLPIVLVTNLDAFHITIYVPETRITEVHIGQRAAVSTDAYPGEAFDGTGDRIAGSAEYAPGNVVTVGDRARRIFAVRIRIPNSDHRLRPGVLAVAMVLP